MESQKNLLLDDGMVMLVKKSIEMEMNRLGKLVEDALLRKRFDKSNTEKAFSMPHKMVQGTRIHLSIRISLLTFKTVFEEELKQYSVYDDTPGTRYYALVDVKVLHSILGKNVCTVSMQGCNASNMVTVRVESRKGRRIGYVRSIDVEKEEAMVVFRGSKIVEKIHFKGFSFNPVLLKYVYNSGNLTILFHRLCLVDDQVNEPYSG